MRTLFFLFALTLVFFAAPLNTQAQADAGADIELQADQPTTSATKWTVEYPKTTVEQADAHTLVPQAPLEEEPADDAAGTGGLLNFIQEHWPALVVLLLAFIEGLLRLTPSEADNSIFNLLKRIIDALLPNRRAAGGLYK